MDDQAIEKLVHTLEERVDGKVLYLAITGSKLHGTASEDSDTDIRGVFMPSITSLITKRNLIDHVNIKSEEDDIVIHSVHSFLRQLHKMESNTVELYFSSTDAGGLYMQAPFESVLEQAAGLMRRDVESFLGMAASTYKRSANRNLTSKQKHKALSHGYRSLFTANEILETGKIVYPCKNAEYLKLIKNNKLEEVDAYFRIMTEEIEEAVALVDEKYEIEVTTDEHLQLMDKILLDLYKDLYKDVPLCV